MRRSRELQASPSPSVRLVRVEELSDRDIEAWRDLEERAIEPNAYLSPHFVLPALRHLDPDQGGLCVLVEEAESPEATRRHLLGLGVFVRSGPTRAFPLPHLVGYMSEHSFLGGLLLDAREAGPALEALFAFLPTGAAPCHGVIFHEMRVDGPVGAGLSRRWPRELTAVVLDRKHRAGMVPKEDSATYRVQQSASRAKAFRKRQRRLAQHGQVTWSAHHAPEGVPALIERFLDLEHRGWKKDAGTSLLSTASGGAFFREVFQAFGREGRTFFTELSVGETVVAATCNLKSGRTCFAFKVAWEPSLAKQSPGTLNELYLIQEGPTVCRDLDWLDSGAAPGSFIDDLWLERSEIARVVVPLTPWARIALRLVDGLRVARRRVAAYADGTAS